MIVLLHHDPALVDREALAILTGRSKDTIRLRLTPVKYRQGRALYDLDAAVRILASIPTRRRGVG